MIATLQFVLPDEEGAFLLAQRGAGYHSFLIYLRDQLRTWRKHGHQFNNADEVIEYLWEAICSDPKLEMDDIG